MASNNSDRVKWSVLQIFGLALVAGDGPLTVAYIVTRDSVVRNAMISFVFMMGVVFCGLVIFKPENFYHPQDIPAKNISNKTGIINPKPIVDKTDKSLPTSQSRKRLVKANV